MFRSPAKHGRSEQPTEGGKKDSADGGRDRNPRSEYSCYVLHQGRSENLCRCIRVCTQGAHAPILFRSRPNLSPTPRSSTHKDLVIRGALLLLSAGVLLFGFRPAAASPIADLNSAIAQELNPLRGAAYAEARRQVLLKHRELIAATPPMNAIATSGWAHPWGRNDTAMFFGSVLRCWLEHPGESASYQAVLFGRYDALLPKASAAFEAPIAKIAHHLESYGTEYLPLAEEYLFQFPAFARHNSYTAIALVFLKLDAPRGRRVFAHGWRRAIREQSELAWLFLDGIVTLHAIELLPELRKQYHAAKTIEERNSYRMTLAGLRDEETDKDVQVQLKRQDLPPVEREALLDAYLLKRGGSQALALAAAYKELRDPLNRLAIAGRLTLYTGAEVAAWQQLGNVEGEVALRTIIRGKIREYQRAREEAERLVQ